MPTLFKLPDRWLNLDHVVDCFYAGDDSGDLVVVTGAVEAAATGPPHDQAWVTDAHHVRVAAADAPALAARLDALARA